MLSQLAALLLWTDHRIRGTQQCSFAAFRADVFARLRPVLNRDVPGRVAHATGVTREKPFDRRDFRARW